MNVKTLIAASTLALIGTTAFAFETPDLATPSTLTRAEVQAELLRARAAGELPRSSQPYYTVDAALVAAQNPSRSRADVVREITTAKSANEAYGTVVIGDGVRSRAEVQAEAQRTGSIRMAGGE